MKIPATPYRPTSWTSDLLNINKLNQMSNNDQWLFENTPRVRYNSSGLIRDNGMKILSGKAYRAPIVQTFQYIQIYFGSFFSAGCKPVVTLGLEGGNHRAKVVAQGYGGEIDTRGFTAVVTTEAEDLRIAGWVHWQAVGY